MSFEQATVLVTGGTSGIGRATAQLFGDRGAKVVVSGRDEARGQEVAAETGGRFIRADLASPEDVQRLAAEAGEVDVLVNNAGFWELGRECRDHRGGLRGDGRGELPRAVLPHRGARPGQWPHAAAGRS